MISHGTKQDNTGNAATAQGEVTSAYVRAAAEPTTSTRSVIGTGETLDAGVYTAGSTLEVSGSLTLDGENNPNAIFVFKAGSALNVDGGSTINLINGANDCNIYWQVTSSATVNTTANFHGTILALTSITALHDATVHGRLLARNGTVTLDDDHILVPDCTTGGGGSGSSGPSSTATSTTTPGASSTTAPTTVGITPRNGPTGGGTVVRLTGTGYVPGGTTVTVGGQKIPTSGVHVTSKTHLHFTMPAHGTGRVNVVVHTAGGTSQRAVFTYLATGVTSSAAGTTTTSLASTGAPVGALSGLAALLLLGGTAVLFVSRRRIGPKHHR